MRLGRPDRKRRGEVKKTVGANGKPKHCSSGSVVGELSPDYIATYFGPEILRLARESLETYASDLVEYDDLLAQYNNMTEQDSAEVDVDVDADGTITNVKANMDEPVKPPRPLYYSEHWLTELEEMLDQTTEHFQSKQGAWKVHAKAAKFERMLDEKYGIFRPFVTNHPELEQFVRSMQRKYATGYFSPLRQSKPPIPRSTAVVILFMMYRGKMQWEVLTLAALFFLIGLQPWALVVLVAGWHGLLERRRKRPLSSMKSFVPLTDSYYAVEATDNDTNNNIEKDNGDGGDDGDGSAEDKAKNDILCRPVGTPITEVGKLDAADYDAIILGSGPTPLFVGSLLSRAGRRVVVLSPRADASGCFTVSGGQPEEMKAFENVPFDVESTNMSKISKQQRLLAPALCTNTDCQGGIRFAKIGSPSDGYAFEILSVPGMGANGARAAGDDLPFVLRGDGVRSLMEDAAQFLADGWPGIHGEIGKSTTGTYVKGMEEVNNSSNQFFLAKLLADNVNDMRSNSSYHDAAIRYAGAFLDKCFPANAHTRSLMAAIGMKGENIKPSMTSMGAHITNISSVMSGEGMHYPVGGPRALCHALANVIEKSGGLVVTGASATELLFAPEDPKAAAATTSDDSKETVVPPRCIGVKMQDQELKFDATRQNNGIEPVVISTHSLITTFIRLLPDHIRTKYKVPRGLPALAERRPVFKIMFGLNGSAQDLNITGADYYRLPNAGLAQDTVDENGAIRLGEIGWSNEHTDGNEEVTVEAVNKDDSEDKASSSDQTKSDDANPQTADVSSATRSKTDKANAIASSSSLSKPKRQRRNKFDTGISYLQISFPSAKDPSFATRHGDVSTCVVTIEADDDFVTAFDTKPKLFAIQKNKSTGGDYQRLMERVKRDLFQIYPQLQGKLAHAQLIGPLHRGLSHTPERYAAKGVRPETPYPGLYVAGSDLTVGESLSGALVGGWLAVNAVIGYATIDHLFLNKNITTDLQEFMDVPDDDEQEDVAVPYQTAA